MGNITIDNTKNHKNVSIIGELKSHINDYNFIVKNSSASVADCYIMEYILHTNIIHNLITSDNFLQDILYFTKKLRESMSRQENEYSLGNNINKFLSEDNN